MKLFRKFFFFGNLHADLDYFRDHIRDVLWDGTFNLRAFAAASEFCEWVQVGIDVYEPQQNYNLKLRPSPKFSPTTFFSYLNKVVLLSLRLSQPNLFC